MRRPDSNPTEELAEIMARLNQMQRQQAKLNDEMDELVKRIGNISGKIQPPKEQRKPKD